MSAPRLALLIVSAVAVAGCLSSEEATCDPQTFVTIHYATVLDTAQLRAALEERGYTWEERNGTAGFRPPGGPASGVRGIVSEAPGPSGPGTIVSVEEDAGSLAGASPVAVAEEVAAVVNETYVPPPTIDRWLVGDHALC